jgi:hypothetical protein
MANTFKKWLEQRTAISSQRALLVAGARPIILKSQSQSMAPMLRSVSCISNMGPNVYLGELLGKGQFGAVYVLSDSSPKGAKDNGWIVKVSNLNGDPERT